MTIEVRRCSIHGSLGGCITNADLPQFSDRQLLPASGTLFFFAALLGDCGDAARSRVLYSSHSCQGVAPRAKPENVGRLFPEDEGRCGGWLAATEYWSQVAFRHPVTFHRFLSYPQGTVTLSWEGEEPECGDVTRESQQLERESLRTALGEPLVALHESTTQRYLGWPDWLKSWLHVRHVVNALRHRVAAVPWKQEARMAQALAVATRVFELSERLAQERGSLDGMSLVDPEAMQQLLQALDAMRQGCAALLSPFYFEELAWRGVEFASHLCTTLGRDDLLPAAFAEYVAQRTNWRVVGFEDSAGSYLTCPSHQICGHSRNRQSEADAFRGQVLLLQIDGERGLHLYQEGSATLYWFIRHQQLRRKKLDRVSFTSSW